MMTQQEVSEALGLPLWKVRALEERAIQKLRGSSQYQQLRIFMEDDQKLGREILNLEEAE